MALTITNNISSLIAQNSLTRTSSALSTSLQRLSTGLKINSGADDPAGLVISEEQRAQISGIQTAVNNTSKAVNVVQTAEGALNEVNSLLDQIRGLAVDSANIGVNDPAALAANQAQITNALTTINSIAQQTQFGQKKLLDGTVGQQIAITAGNQNVTSVTGGPNTVPGNYTLNITQTGIKGQGTAASNFSALTQSTTITTANNTISAGSLTAAPTTQAGNYTISYVQQGVRASVTGTAFGATLTANETLTVTGAFNSTLQLTGGHNLAQTISDVNAQLAQQGITNYVAQDGGGKLQFVATQYGAAAAINVTSNLAANGSGFTTTTTNGTAGQALIVSVNGGPNINASGAAGTFVNLSSGPGAGLSYTAAETAPAHAGSLSLTTVGGGAGALTEGIQVTGSETLTLNGVAINLNSQNANNITAAIATINSYSSQTGVTADQNGSAVRFTANAFGGNVQALESGDYGSGLYKLGVGAGGLTANGQALLGTITDQNGNVSASLKGSGSSGNLLVGTSGTSTGLTFNVAVNGATPTQTVAAGSQVKATLNDGLVFQIGANFGQTATISINQISTSTIGQNVTGLNNATTNSLAKIDVTDPTGKNAQDAIKVIDQAISDVSNLRGRLGAFQSNNLQANANNLRTTLQNTQAAESTIRDTDFAAETANYTKNQVLLQAGTQVLSNANQTAQLVLGLIPRG